MTLSTPARRWKRVVDEIMKRDYLIDLDDAGASDEDIERYLESGESPSDFVEWLAEKYGLDSIDVVWTSCFKQP